MSSTPGASESRIQTLKTLVGMLMGRRSAFSSLSSATLDIDDVLLARKWLKQPESWRDRSVTEAYEKTFTDWIGARFGFAFETGRTALSACIHALDLKPGDHVIIPGYTCVVVDNAFRFAGCRISYCDIELETFGPDAGSLKHLVTPDTRAIVIHHLYGLVCRDLEPIMALSREHGIPVIEDCAQAAGAEFKAARVGNFGDLSFFSSEQSKVINTIQGGVAVTNREDLAARIKHYQEEADFPNMQRIGRLLMTAVHNYYRHRNTGWSLTGSHAVFRYASRRVISTTQEEIEGKKPEGYGCRLSAAAAALGLNQLKKIDHYNRLRRETAAKWDRWCEEKGYDPPTVLPDSLPVFLRYPVIVEPERKKDLSWAEKDPGVRPGVWFVSHLHPSNRTVSDCPNATRAVQGCVNFPGILS